MQNFCVLAKLIINVYIVQNKWKEQARPMELKSLRNEYHSACYREIESRYSRPIQKEDLETSEMVSFFSPTLIEKEPSNFLGRPKPEYYVQ